MPKTHFPRLIHRIWLGPPIPTRLDEWWETWGALNPEWTRHSWTEKDLEPLVDRVGLGAVYQWVKRPVLQSDIGRLVILWMYGGLYVDADFECLKPIETLVRQWEREGRRLVMSAEPYRKATGEMRVSNAIALSEPRHEALRWMIGEAVRRLSEATTQTRSPNPIYVTGPSLWRAATQIHHNTVHVIPPWIFVPFGGDTLVDDVKDQSRLPQDTPVPDRSFAVHHFAANWYGGK